MSEQVMLAHGNGGRYMRELIEQVIAPALEDVIVDTENDAVAVALPESPYELLMTTDGFTVKPLLFPGGSIGSLAIHGTVNDLAVSGARPLYLSLNMFIEEGFEFNSLIAILGQMRLAALEANIKIVCGDTKVLPKGDIAGLYLATTGVGVRATSNRYGFSHIQTGDKVLVSGPVGDHGIAVMFAREQYGIRGDLQSDAASVLPLTMAANEIAGVRFMRDPTRGGLATVLHELQRATGLGLAIEMQQVPVRESVSLVCDMMGYDPLYLACEGRVIAVVSEQDADGLLAQWRITKNGEQAEIIGQVLDASQNFVIIKTDLGGERILEELEDDPLPRIC